MDWQTTRVLIIGMGIICGTCLSLLAGIAIAYVLKWIYGLAVMLARQTLRPGYASKDIKTHWQSHQQYREYWKATADIAGTKREADAAICQAQQARQTAERAMTAEDSPTTVLIPIVPIAIDEEKVIDPIVVDKPETPGPPGRQARQVKGGNVQVWSETGRHGRNWDGHKIKVKIKGSKNEKQK